MPPGTGICHQVNLEYLAQTVWTAKEKRDGKTVEVAFPDTLVGTDSHTTMVNGLAVLGWGSGGIEAEAAMLGQPLSMLLPEVIGFKLEGELREGVTATDLVLTVTQMLRKKGVVGKFVEFYGPGLNAMTVADRATIANMAPEYGATCGLFPIDAQTLAYLKTTGRKPSRLALVEAYAKAQGACRTRARPPIPSITDTLELNLGEVAASLAGPKRPQDRVVLTEAKAGFAAAMANEFTAGRDDRRAPQGRGDELRSRPRRRGHRRHHLLHQHLQSERDDGRRASGAQRGRQGPAVKPWVKTSLAPGSQVVEDYLKEADLQKPLDKLGFNIVGFGCTTCIGNSGPLRPRSRRRSPSTTWSPPRCCRATATSRAASIRTCGRTTSLRRRWSSLTRSPARCRSTSPASRSAPTSTASPSISPTSGRRRKKSRITSRRPSARKCSRRNMRACSTATPTGARSRRLPARPTRGTCGSTYVQEPPYFEGLTKTPVPVADIENARILALLFLDSITTDHISPAGSIKAASPAGEYLIEHQVRPVD